VPDKQREEQWHLFLNKVSQFVLVTGHSPAIIGTAKSTVNFGKCMNEGKIVGLNLSQRENWRRQFSFAWGNDDYKLQLAAMNRVLYSRAERRDFYPLC